MSPIRKLLLFLSIGVSFVAVADGLAMTLPGPASEAGGGALLALGLTWLLAVFPRFLSPGARSFSRVLVARMGLLLLPALYLPVAGLWLVATPSAMTVWFSVAWLSVWLACLVATAVLVCPICNDVFGRVRFQLHLTSSLCAHCGADARAGV